MPDFSTPAGRRFPVAFLLLVTALALAAFLARERSASGGRDPAPHQPAGTIGGPVREVTEDHRPKRVAHGDAAGLVPLEIVHTAEGAITIQRTFSNGGKLLKEEAFLNGRQVPVPAAGEISGQGGDAGKE